MRPIREIDAATCRGLRAVAFDVDDTLTRGGRIETAALDALYTLRASGLCLIAVTGRPLGFAELLARLLPIDAAVGENGAGLVRVDGSGVHLEYADDEPTRSAQRTLLSRVQARVLRELPFAHLTDDHWARHCDVAFDVAERVRLDTAQVARLVALIEAQGARAVVSSVHVHAFASHHDKTTGIDLALRRLRAGSIPDTSVLFVGDSANDATAFARYEVSAGVANVREHLHALPAPPRYVSDADRGRGFGEIARVVIEHRA